MKLDIRSMCVGAGGAATLTLAATGIAQQSPVPKAYVMGEITVTDPAAYADYARQVPPIMAKYGGRYLARGGRAEALEGAAPARLVIVEYPSADAARAFWNSPEYRRIAEIRHRASTGRLALVEGLGP